MVGAASRGKGWVGDDWALEALALTKPGLTCAAVRLSQPLMSSDCSTGGLSATQALHLMIQRSGQRFAPLDLNRPQAFAQCRPRIQVHTAPEMAAVNSIALARR